MSGDEQQILGLYVQMLQRIFFAHVVERIGRVVQIDEQLVARNADHAGRLALLVAVLQAHVGQFGHDDQLAIDDLDALEREQERMPDQFHAR